MLPTSITLELVAPDRQVLRDAVESIQLPALGGELGILPGHAPLLTELGIGEMSYLKSGQRYYATVMGGFAEVLGDRVIVLAEHSERAEEIDVTRARAAQERAQKRLTPTAVSDVDFERAQNAMRRALLRQLVASRAGAFPGPTIQHGPR